MWAFPQWLQTRPRLSLTVQTPEEEGLDNLLLLMEATEIPTFRPLPPPVLSSITEHMKETLWADRPLRKEESSPNTQLCRVQCCQCRHTRQREGQRWAAQQGNINIWSRTDWQMNKRPQTALPAKHRFPTEPGNGYRTLYTYITVRVVLSYS